TAATLLAGAGTVVFDDFEIVKGFGPRPAGPFTVPVLTNHAEVPRIAADLAARLTPDAVPAALIDRHGATTWGPDLETARNRMECLEMLCALQLRTGGDRS
ncbi:class II aldolase/adducin family protein, partial [Nocardia elegans]